MLDPVALAPAASEKALENVERFLVLAAAQLQARIVEQRAQIVWLEVYGAPRPFQPAFALAVVE
jgi:hypothetical protein